MINRQRQIEEAVMTTLRWILLIAAIVTTIMAVFMKRDDR